MWHNPYKDGRHAVAAEVNRERVRRQKEEREFIKGIHSSYKLDNIPNIRQKLNDDDTVKFMHLQEARGASTRAETARTEEAESAGAVPPEPHTKLLGTVRGTVRCVEPTQGGATLWTAEEDGSIGIRNGLTGELVFSVERTEGAHVNALHASGNLMWTGFDDGSIRIYDQVVYILAFEASRHSQSVAAFAETFDGRTFSASLDGSVVKWDTEAREFAGLGEIRDSAHAARAVACYGYHLFVGFDSNVIRGYDMETLVPVREYRGHTGSITALAVLDGYLYSGSEDRSVCIWDLRIDDAPLQVLEAHESAVTTLLVDTVGHRVWSGDRDGAVVVWDCTPRHPVVTMCQLPATGHAITSLKGFLAFDSVKLWTLGSNGVNFVWSSNRNGMEDSLLSIVASMDHVIEQDQRELAKWNELIRTLVSVNDRLEVTSANRLGELNDSTTTRKAFGVWRTWLLGKQRTSQRQRMAAGVELRSHARLAASALHKWRIFLAARQRRRQGEASAVPMCSDEHAVAQLEGFRKLRVFYENMRRLVTRRHVASALASRAEATVLRRYFALIGQYRVRRVMRRRFLMRTATIQTWSDLHVARSLYVRWARFTEKQRQRSQRAAVAFALLSAAQRTLLLQYWLAFIRFAAGRRTMRVAIQQLRILSVRTEVALLSTYFSTLRRFAFRNVSTRHRAALAAGMERTAEMETALRELQHLIRRRALLDETRTLVEKSRAELAKRREKFAQVQAANTELEELILAKREASKVARERTLAEQVDDFIATLKSRILNVNSDMPLIAKIVEKNKTIPATKTFLESHLAIKKIVIELTKQMHLLPDAEWPLTMPMIRRLPGHHVETSLTALKTMIIAFDMLTAEERAGLLTDQEISLNAQWLLAIAEHCVAVKTRKFGGGPRRSV